MAIYLAFFLPFGLSILFGTDVSNLLLYDTRLLAILGAATMIFLLGLWDDLHSLPPSIKFLFQLFIGLLTWLGGVQINTLSISLTSGVELGWLSLPVTLFWIVLVINAINLIDGLDGLAAGVSLFAALLMLLICLITDKLLIALGFAALAGATMGFLRYNFNPASIFMGDCGSYFLGYTIAALSILGSVKGKATLAMLIPFIALGVPLFDALLAPIRRFLLGRKMFSPDKKHLHHRLIKYGLTQRNAVLILYGITVLLSITALALVYVRDEEAAFILLIPVAVGLFAFRKLGYLNYFAVDKVYGWLCDITDASGVSHERRTFLDLQVQISKAPSLEDMWKVAGRAFERIEFDKVTLQLSTPSGQGQSCHQVVWHGNKEGQQKEAASAVEGHDNFRLKLTLPLVERERDMAKRWTKSNKQQSVTFLGTLVLEKDIEKSSVSHYTLRRVEDLRRTIMQKLIAGF